MFKISLIFSADYDFQIIGVIKGSSDIAWGHANAMAHEGKFEKIGIEHYDVVEFKDNKEMNDWISEQIKESRVDKAKEEPTYTLREDGIYIVGSHKVVLNEKIKDEELHEYYIVDRKDFIDELISWISEANDSNKAMMKQDLEELMTWDDDYIFSSNSTNAYIRQGDSNFNETCKELIELSESL